jgi:soluble lytic murein transglycosylase
MSKTMRLVGAALALSVFLAAPAATQMSPVPDDDGPRKVRAHSQTLSASDRSLLERAFDAADRKQWEVARDYANRLTSPAARDLVLWRMFTTKDSGGTYSEMDRFLSAHRDWPNQQGLQARVEEAMPASAMTPDQVIAWFQGREPVSGEGMIKLGDAHLRKGQDASAKTWIRKGWIEGNFSLERMGSISSGYRAQLTADDHAARASRLVWDGEFGQANAMTNWVGADVDALISARIKLRQSARDADAAYARVPSHLENDAGLLFDRARWLRKRDRDAEARPFLIRAAQSQDGQPPNAEEWWNERHYQAREALDAGSPQQAYQIVAGHDLRKDAGVPFAEAEFLSGWIALRFLNKPDTAFDHFMRLRDGVTAPISVARAHYWAGRAAEKAGRTADAQRQYESAAVFPMTFYGQLGAAAANPRGSMSLPPSRATSTSTRQAFMDQSVMQAMQALADIGEEGTMRTFALATSETFTERDQFVLLTNFLRQLNQPALALRIAKRGLQKNIPVYDIAYPTISLPVYRGNGTPPESALVLGLTRQESEFDSDALSSAGARGLMQMMPATAKLTARQHRVGYNNKADLMVPSLNLQLGMAHVSDLLENFAGSYVLTIASYNAGGGRANQWISTYGDPRATNADVVDWIERIPFHETRNYVQRVLENTQVYRHILAGRDVPLTVAADLKRGAYTNVASAEPQFSSSPAPATTAAAPTPAFAPPPPGAQFASVISSTPVPDDPEPAVSSKKGKKGKVVKKKRRGSGAAASNSTKRCKGTATKNCRKRS